MPSIDEARVQQYKSNVILLYQRQGAKLRGTTQLESVRGKSHFFERLGGTSAVKKTVRHADTPLIAPDHSRRMVTMSDYEWATLLDKQDEIRILIEPKSKYAQNAAWALGRAFDAELISAFNGVAKAGENGTIDVAFPGSQVIPHGNENLTIAKLLEAKFLLDDKDVPEEGRFIVISPKGLESLLNTTKVTSADFNTIQALVRGDLKTYLGFEFIKHTGLPKVGNIRSAFAWHRDAMAIAEGMDMATRIDERADKGYATQVYVAQTFGATRAQEEGVVEIQYDEAAALAT